MSWKGYKRILSSYNKIYVFLLHQRNRTSRGTYTRSLKKPWDYFEIETKKIIFLDIWDYVRSLRFASSGKVLIYGIYNTLLRQAVASEYDVHLPLIWGKQQALFHQKHLCKFGGSLTLCSGYASSFSQILKIHSFSRVVQLHMMVLHLGWVLSRITKNCAFLFSLSGKV